MRERERARERERENLGNGGVDAIAEIMERQLFWIQWRDYLKQLSDLKKSLKLKQNLRSQILKLKEKESGKCNGKWRNECKV